MVAREKLSLSEIAVMCFRPCLLWCLYLLMLVNRSDTHSRYSLSTSNECTYALTVQEVSEMSIKKKTGKENQMNESFIAENDK